ncbi:MAG TPA: diacylglycerol kinase family protein [Longimicrobiales bacterium]|nr:diacylglycerol kinase family protein [Longimicrobiales bacterium]
MEAKDPTRIRPGRALVIVNPNAGQDPPERLRRALGGALAARNVPFDLVETLEPGHATELARAAITDGYTAVAAAGGDGTLAEVATGLVGSDVPLAIVPRGTANQVARNLGIPTDVEGAAEVIARGRAVPVDLGRADDRVFALAVGAGLDAVVMSATSREMKERWGFAAYIYATIREAVRTAPVDFRVVADGEELRIRALSVMVANVGELFAGILPSVLPSLSLAPAGERALDTWRDGLLDVVVVAPAGVMGMASVLWQSASGAFAGDKHLFHRRAREVTVDADAPVPLQVDGDPGGTTPVRITVVPDDLRVLIPA